MTNLDRAGARADIGVETPGRRGRMGLPLAVWGIALLAALFHMTTFWHAQSETPEGWEFTGTLSFSPDYMQYRTWMRQAQDAGPIVPDKLTPETNRPHLPVFFYYGVGQVSKLTGVRPEFAYEYAGAILAFVFVLVLFVTVRLFFVRRYETWWVFLVILLGGGLAAHLKIAYMIGPIRRSPISRLIRPVFESLSFDSMRFAYVYKVLMDTHFLVIYLFTTLTLLACYFAVRRRAARYYVGAAVLVAATTLIHVYEGVLLIAIILTLAALLYLKDRLDARRGLLLVGLCGGAAVVTLGAIVYMQEMSGLPVTQWSAPEMFFSNIALGYPIGWAALAWGGASFWRTADTKRLFLLAWIVGCTLMLLSSPYYPFADRGVTTLQIPLYIAAGLIFFERRSRVSPKIALLLVLVLGASAPLTVSQRWDATSFAPDKPFQFLDAEHRETLEILEEVASSEDVLLADYFEYRWLMPEFPGRGFHPHFFLTVDWERREREVERFFSDAAAGERAAFLAGEGVDFVWVSAERDPVRIGRTPGLHPIDRGPHGMLFRFEEPAVPADEAGRVRDGGARGRHRAPRP